MPTYKCGQCVLLHSVMCGLCQSQGANNVLFYNRMNKIRQGRHSMTPVNTHNMFLTETVLLLVVMLNQGQKAVILFPTELLTCVLHTLSWA